MTSFPRFLCLHGPAPGEKLRICLPICRKAHSPVARSNSSAFSPSQSEAEKEVSKLFVVAVAFFPLVVFRISCYGNWQQPTLYEVFSSFLSESKHCRANECVGLQVTMKFLHAHAVVKICICRMARTSTGQPAKGTWWNTAAFRTWAMRSSQYFEGGDQEVVIGAWTQIVLNLFVPVPDQNH